MKSYRIAKYQQQCRASTVMQSYRFAASKRQAQHQLSLLFFSHQKLIQAFSVTRSKVGSFSVTGSSVGSFSVTGSSVGSFFSHRELSQVFFPPLEAKLGLFSVPGSSVGSFFCPWKLSWVFFQSMQAQLGIFPFRHFFFFFFLRQLKLSFAFFRQTLVAQHCLLSGTFSSVLSQYTVYRHLQLKIVFSGTVDTVDNNIEDKITDGAQRTKGKKR